VTGFIAAIAGPLLAAFLMTGALIYMGRLLGQLVGSIF
jgi:hypothetical protein